MFADLSTPTVTAHVLQELGRKHISGAFRAHGTSGGCNVVLPAEKI